MGNSDEPYTVRKRRGAGVGTCDQCGRKKALKTFEIKKADRSDHHTNWVRIVRRTDIMHFPDAPNATICSRKCAKLYGQPQMALRRLQGRG